MNDEKIPFDGLPASEFEGLPQAAISNIISFLGGSSMANFGASCSKHFFMVNREEYWWSRFEDDFPVEYETFASSRRSTNLTELLVNQCQRIFQPCAGHQLYSVEQEKKNRFIRQARARCRDSLHTFERKSWFGWYGGLTARGTARVDVPVKKSSKKSGKSSKRRKKNKGTATMQTGAINTDRDLNQMILSGTSVRELQAMEDESDPENWTSEDNEDDIETMIIHVILPNTTEAKFRVPLIHDHRLIKRKLKLVTGIPIRAMFLSQSADGAANEYHLHTVFNQEDASKYTSGSDSDFDDRPQWDATWPLHFDYVGVEGPLHTLQIDPDTNVGLAIHMLAEKSNTYQYSRLIVAGRLLDPSQTWRAQAVESDAVMMVAVSPDPNKAVCGIVCECGYTNRGDGDDGDDDDDDDDDDGNNDDQNFNFDGGDHLAHGDSKNPAADNFQNQNASESSICSPSPHSHITSQSHRLDTSSPNPAVPSI